MDLFRLEAHAVCMTDMNQTSPASGHWREHLASDVQSIPPQAMLCTYTVFYELDIPSNDGRQSVMVFAYTAELAAETVRRFHARDRIDIVGILDGATLGLTPA